MTTKLSKQQKKLQRGFYAAQRNTWSMKPITRVVKSGKTYDRASFKKEARI